MNPLSSHLLCLLALLGAVNPLSAADNAKYRPPLEPRFTAGQTFGYSADAEYKSLILSVEHLNGVNDDGSPRRADKYLANIPTRFAVKFVAESALARQVFKNGSLSEAVFQVSLCQLVDEKNGLQNLLPRGAILTARKQKDGQVAFAINGVAPDAQLAAQLSVVIAMGNEQATNNDLLSPPQPVSIAADWPINLQAVINSDLPKCFPGVKSVAGSVSLVSVQTDKTGGPRGVINADYSLIGVTPPFGSEFKADPSTVNFKVLTTAPIAGGPGRYDLKLSSSVNHAGHTGNAQVGFAASDAEFTISVQQNIHFILDSSLPTVAALAAAPAAPDAPPVPAGLSSANIYRPPPMWKGKAPSGANPAAVAGPDKSSTPATTPNPIPAAPTPKPKSPATTTPFVLPSGDPSPFANAKDPLTLPTSPSNSK